MKVDEVRRTLTRGHVIEAAVALADAHGMGAVSMRRLGQELGVEAMSLYTHVRSKDDLLEGMVEFVMDEVRRPAESDDWKWSLRSTVLGARAVLLRHPWAPAVIETRAEPGPLMLAHYNAVMGILRRGGFSLEMTHHALHLLGSRLLGFTQDLFDDSPDLPPEAATALAEQLRPTLAYVAEMALGASHQGGLGGCDTDLEFSFSLDVILDGLERLRDKPVVAE